MTFKDKMFLESKAWAEEKLSLDAGYFDRLGGMHSPDILWIGSSDNLVSIEELANAEPGEILVCHNIASQVREDDIAMMAIIEEAVINAEVGHIVVCGYSHCSGVRQVLSRDRPMPVLDRWLANMTGLYETHRRELDGLGFEDRGRRLAELNIEYQIRNLAQLDCIRRAWDTRDRPSLHGWYFDLPTGALKEVCAMDRNDNFRKVDSLTVLQL